MSFFNDAQKDAYWFVRRRAANNGSFLLPRENYNAYYEGKRVTD